MIGRTRPLYIENYLLGDSNSFSKTIQPASEMEEMEMLRRAIEISMLEERSRKTEQLLLNKPVSQLKGAFLIM